MSTNYNYLKAVCDDVRTYINDNITLSDYEDKYALEEYLNDTLWVEDSVTGNASGSYTFNTYKAEENLCHNLDLLEEVCTEFGGDMAEYVSRGAQYCDVSIRCYLLGQAIAEVLDEFDDDDFGGNDE